MSVLIDENTKVLIHGMTGREGSFHSEQMLKFGTKIVAGVTPGKGGQVVLGVKIFNRASEAVNKTKANASVIFVPSAHCKSAITDALEAGIKLIITITEGMPVHDMIDVVAMLKEHQARMIGPNCPGLTSPGVSKLGIMPNNLFTKGEVGIISRSGTLTYEIITLLTQAGIGQSTCIGVGGDPILGLTFVELLPDFENDTETKAVVLVGEIGGSDEEIAAEYISSKMKKPVVAFISGKSAPEGKKMGHAGAIIAGGLGTAESKVKALTKANIIIAETIYDISKLIQEVRK